MTATAFGHFTQRYNLTLIPTLNFKPQVTLVHGTLRDDTVDLLIWAMHALASFWSSQDAMANLY
jgi:hypothetical protein